SGLSDRIGMVPLFKASVFLMGASYLIWLCLRGHGWLIIFATVLGLGYGVRIAMMPGVLVEYFGLRNPGTILGVFFTASGLASIFGPLAAGWIVDRSGGYTWAVVFALVMGTLGFLAILPLKPIASQRHDEAVNDSAL